MQKRQPPAVFRIDHRRIEQHDGAERAERRADPEAAVDDEIGPAAHARGDQLLDGRVDRGVFAADARAGEEAEQREAPEIPRQRGRRGGDEIDRERDEEQLLAAEPVGQPAEEQRAQHRAGEIGAGGEADVGIAELQDRARLQCAGDRAGERHFEPVEDPGDAERRDHQGVEAAPRQAVEPRRDVGFDDGAIAARSAAPSPANAKQRDFVLAYHRARLQQKHRLLAEQIPEPPRRVEPQRRAPGVERHRALHLGAGDLAELAEVLDGAEVDVGRVVPGIRQIVGAAACGRRTASCRRMRQWPKFGNDTMACRPMRSMCSSTTRGWRVACSVCDRIT